jgi:phosphoribosylaminoimidazolecarboxamide formyltransferase/IMP cyclohydrolase
MGKAALLSVSDRSSLDSFAHSLSELGFTLLASSGTRKYLEDGGIQVLSIEEYTGQKEILGGRVKTLHPKIHAGILARRDNPDDMRELQEQGILPIDIVAVNHYPFDRNLDSERAKNPSEMVGLIDIGGPTMIRAAAKNHAHVLGLIDPADYQRIIAFLQQGEVPLELREELAVKVFARLADYNLQIA